MKFYLGFGQLVVAELNEVLNLANEVVKLDASHVEQRASALWLNSLALGLIMFFLQVGNDVKGGRAVRVEALDEVGIELDFLQLVAVGYVFLLLKPLVHASQALHEHLALAISLGLGSGLRRGSVAFSAHGRGHGRVGSSNAAV